MYARNKLVITAFILAGLLSLLGLFRLFALRFARGDMFPPYSSLRSDPLGCKALFMALERTPGLEVTRNFRSPDKLKDIRGGTIFYPGAEESLMDASADKQVEQLEALAGLGNRLVISFVPGRKNTFVATSGKNSGNGRRVSKRGQRERSPEEKEEAKKSCDNHFGRWGISIDFSDSPAGESKGFFRAIQMDSGYGLPTSIPFHSTRRFRTDNGEWRMIYGYHGQALILERYIGNGSVVLIADSYLLSNEAMRKDRQAAVIAWLQGSNRMALFDEYHLGVSENPGVMTLIRKYHLLPLLFALMMLAVLHVWKSAVPFVGILHPEKTQLNGVNRDNFSGLVNLLRRNIVQANLLENCYREWLKSFAREARQRPVMVEQIRKVVERESARPAQKRNPLAAYREIAGILSNFRLR